MMQNQNPNLPQSYIGNLNPLDLDRVNSKLTEIVYNTRLLAQMIEGFVGANNFVVFDHTIQRIVFIGSSDECNLYVSRPDNEGRQFLLHHGASFACYYASRLAMPLTLTFGNT